MTFPYTNTDHGFKIEIKTDFDFDQSNPLQYQYLFRYTILITNVGEVQAQLLSRKWNIKDAHGEIKFVEGPGVIGQTPNFERGHTFEYSSFCPLPTMQGEMWGHFNMINKFGQAFKIETPVFKFHVPKDYIDDY